jgi:hypothetical protein
MAKATAVPVYVLAVEYRMIGEQSVWTKRFVGPECGKEANQFLATIQAKKVLNPISKAWEIVRPAKADYHSVYVPLRDEQGLPTVGR